MADLTPAKRLFDLLVTRDFEVETLDSSGKANPDPSDAEIFSFDFTTSSGNNYGTVVIMYGDDNSLDLYTSDNVGRTMEGPDKEEWFAFQHQLKDFAMRNNSPAFNIKNINKLKYSMQGQAAIKEGLFESWTGNKHTSWNDKPEHVRLMIKHKRPIGEADARYRYIESLFVETSDGERFKLPFTKLSGGRAMCEHVRAGGKPYDARGVHIASIVEELNVLSRFRRANHGKVFEGDTAELINETNVYYETLHKILKGLGSKRGYTNYFECWNPAAITEQELVVESIKNMFVRQSLDERIEEALPILARIQQQGRTMKEANIFESWANRLMEGTWATPETPEQKEKLVTMLSQELPVGADATNATEQLYDVLGDDVLFDQLENLADQDANADARQTILDRMQELADDPNVAEVIAQLNIDVDSTPEVDVDAEVTADETGVEQDIEEEQQLNEFLPALAAAAGEMGGAAVASELGLGATGTQLAKQVGSSLASNAVAGGGDTQPENPGVIDSIKNMMFGEDDLDETINPKNPKDYEIPAYLRKQQGQAPLTMKDVQDKEGRAKAEYQKRLGIGEEEVRSGALSPFSEEEALDEIGHPGAACTTGNPPLEESSEFLARLQSLANIKKAANEAVVMKPGLALLNKPDEKWTNPDAEAEVNAQAKNDALIAAIGYGPSGVPDFTGQHTNGGTNTPAGKPANTTSSNKEKYMGPADVVDVDAKEVKEYHTPGGTYTDSEGNTEQDIINTAELERLKKDLGVRPGVSPQGPYDTDKVGGPNMQPDMAREDESPLKGKYGHPGKLKAVSENDDFLGRLRELSGLVK